MNENKTKGLDPELGLPLVYLESFELAKQQLAEHVAACRTPMELAKMLYEQYNLEPFGSRLSERMGVKPVLAVVAANSDGHEYYKPIDPFSYIEASEWISVSEAISRVDEQFTEAERWRLDHGLRYITGSRELAHHPEGWHYARLCQAGSQALWRPVDAPKPTRTIRAFRHYSVSSFWKEFRDQFVWDLLPAKFLYDLYLSWSALSYPGEMPQDILLFRRALATLVLDDAMWERPKAEKTATARRMVAPEPLIAKYDLERWRNSTYTGTNHLRISVFDRPAPNYRWCLKRVTLPSPTPGQAR